MAHKYLNDIGIESDEICIFNTEQIDDERQKKFDEEREQYGFDSRETWSLDFTMITWLYSHLKMYLELGGKIVDLTFYKFDIPVIKILKEDELQYEREGDRFPITYTAEEIRTQVTQEECIKIILDYFEDYLMANTHVDENKFEDYNEEVDASVKRENVANSKASCGLKILGTIFGAIWW